MKNILMALMVLLSSTVYAEKVVVIPMAGDDIIKEVDVCNGVPIGDDIFELDVTTSAALRKGSLLSTPQGFLVEITGIVLDYYPPRWSDNNVRYAEGEFFHDTLDELPDPRTDVVDGEGNPSFGIRGPFYYFSNGDIAYAKYL